MRRWLKEPLLHFLVIGAVLFALFYQVADPETVSDNRIVISEADIERLITLFERRWQRLPSQEEINGLVDAEIREEILYHEAVRYELLAVPRREANQAFYKTLRDRYTVFVEQPTRAQRVASAAPIQ